MLTEVEQSAYERDGYVVLRKAISEAEIQRLERGVENNPPLDATLDPNAPVYPNPGRYTLACQAAADPDLAFIIEHPTLVGATTDLLKDDPVLTAYVIYDRTPGGAGLGAHHDYKRWRPVGSSMNWLFTIVPFCDFDQASGPLFVAPGSHHLHRVHSGGGICQEVAPAIKPAPEDFIDPELKRGDLLLMNMHLWHKAAPNNSGKHRVGLFNKYAARSCPPATGYYLYHRDVYDALTEQGKSLLAVYSDRCITHTRALLMRPRNGRYEVYLQPHDAGVELPGGEIYDERAIPAWDIGNYIGPLQHYLREQVQIETPWLSYVGDYDEGAGLCRVYGYTLNDHGFPVAYDGEWVGVDALSEQNFRQDWVPEAAAAWLNPSVVRGKGLSQAQCRIDQFAY